MILDVAVVVAAVEQVVSNERLPVSVPEIWITDAGSSGAGHISPGRHWITSVAFVVNIMGDDVQPSIEHLLFTTQLHPQTTVIVRQCLNTMAF